MTEIHPGLVALGQALFDVYHRDDETKPEPWDINPKRRTWIQMASRLAASGEDAHRMARLAGLRAKGDAKSSA